MKHIERNTFLHAAAFEFFNAVKALTAAFVDSSHVIAIPFAFAPTFLVERNANILIVTVIISVRMILWTTALGLFDVVNICWIADIDALHVIASRTLSPNIFSEKEK